MAGIRQRVDLSDPDAAVYCLVCGDGYRDEVATCTTCGSATVSRADLLERIKEEELPGSPNGPPAIDGDLALLVALPGPHEAGVVRGRLEEAGIPYEVSGETTPFAFSQGALAAVEIYVNAEELERARTAIGAGVKEEPAPRVPATAGPSESQRARLEHRYFITRLFLYLTGSVYVLHGLFLVAAFPLDAAINLASGAALIGLGRWSRSQPEKGFGTALLLVVGVAVWGMVVGRPFAAIPGVICLLAIFYAYEASVKASKSGPRSNS